MVVERFWNWLRWRLLDAITRQLDAINLRVSSEAICTRTGIDVLRREQENTQKALASIGQSLVGLRASNEALRREVTAYPRLSLSILRTWEAVAFACRKTARDRALCENGQPDADTLLWVSHYLREQEWEHPGENVVASLVALHHKIEMEKRVPA